MRKNFGAKSWCYPQPVFIIGTYDENSVPNVMNAAWGGISEVNEITICIDNTHKTADNLKVSGAFTVSIGTEDFVTACDFVGLISGKKEPNKFARAGFTVIKSENVNAPIIAELPMCLECKIKSYDEETCMLKGEIVNISADESILTDGKIDVAKLKPITFDPVNYQYWNFGKIVAKAYGEGKKLL